MTFSFPVRAKLRIVYVVNITISKISNPGRVTFLVKSLPRFYATIPLSLEVNIDITVEKSHCVIIVHESSRRHCMYAWLLALIKIIHCLSTSSNKVISSVPRYWFILMINVDDSPGAFWAGKCNILIIHNAIIKDYHLQSYFL